MPERDLNDLYDLLQAVNVKLAVICERLDTLTTYASDHEKRIRLLEALRWPLPSIAVLISLGSLAAFFLKGS